MGRFVIVIILGILFLNEQGMRFAHWGVSPLYALETADNLDELYLEADKYAKEAPEFRRVDDLVKYLVRPYRQNAYLQVRAIFAWMVYHLTYDSFKANMVLGNLGNGRQHSLNLGNIYKTRIGICGDFADLFLVMAKEAGLRARRIDGYAGYNLTSATLRKSGHAWNAVQIDRKWYLLDVTWALSGSATLFDDTKKAGAYKRAVRERRRHNDEIPIPEDRKIDTFWFLTPPEEMVKTHFPHDPKLEYLKKPIAIEDVLKENRRNERKERKK